MKYSTEAVTEAIFPKHLFFLSRRPLSSDIQHSPSVLRTHHNFQQGNKKNTPNRSKFLGEPKLNKNGSKDLGEGKLFSTNRSRNLEEEVHFSTNG